MLFKLSALAIALFASSTVNVNACATMPLTQLKCPNGLPPANVTHIQQQANISSLDEVQKNYTYVCVFFFVFVRQCLMDPCSNMLCPPDSKCLPNFCSNFPFPAGRQQ